MQEINSGIHYKLPIFDIFFLLFTITNIKDFYSYVYYCNLKVYVSSAQQVELQKIINKWQ